MRPLLLTTLLLIITTSPADTLTGRVVRIVDGDTVVFLDHDKQQHRVRLAGIDTPERKRPFGKRATENLARLAGKRPARLEWCKRDRYKRIIGKVLVDGVDANLHQIRDGLAWHYKRYSSEQSPIDRTRYADAENEARAAKSGLWAEHGAIAPWEWRKKK